ncbi:metallophosphoesterase [Neobacillus notoginsengisoli]|uniref:Metallophosphoesterase n=1 Tax=Neobacillus notoginsengisoli TaxID=1578198 RepID=A0A417YXD2_9BACI|nr:metallophosphoesterase [Neobacillus notoginsengisoli]RHW42065.1 metallophosphoesterase [Neobacillus notoginsengisoli]
MSWTVVAAISAALLIYSLICFYIGYNGWAWLRLNRPLAKYKYLYVALIIFLSLSLFAGRFIPIPFLSLIGGYWMVIVGYSLILLPVINLVVFLFKRKGIYWIGVGVIAFYVIIFTFGTYNAWSPVVRSYDVQIDKPAERGQLKILMASDFHLGSIVGKKHLDRFIAIANKEKPDIILIPGDLIDDYIKPFLKENMGESLNKLHAPMGVFAVLGNHDYYGGDKEQIVQEMEKAGITVLQDEVILVDGELTLVGRKDPTDRSRAALPSFMAAADLSKPVIMLDHQPIAFDEAGENGVDLLVSGHTHRGQVAPAQYITKRIYENDWGYLQKGSLHSVVSSGFGTWGPALRIGTRAEALIINVKFK